MTLPRGVPRSKRVSMRWMRKAAEDGSTPACLSLAQCMYGDHPYSRDTGHVEDAAALPTPAEAMESHGDLNEAFQCAPLEDHDVPPDVLRGVLHWLRESSGDEYAGADALQYLDMFRSDALDGCKYCYADGCEVVGHLKDFKVCPQCKTARYCGAACQAHDWTTGGHKTTCGTAAVQVRKQRATPIGG